MRREIVLVGIGPGPVGMLTRDAEAALRSAERVFFRMSAHPVHAWLVAQGVRTVPFDFAYERPGIARDTVYAFIADAVLREAERTGRAVLALPGHPLVFETTPRLIASAAAARGIDVTIVPGVSFIELTYATLRLDPAAGLQVASAFDATAGFTIADAVGVLFGQVLAAADGGSGGPPSGADVLGRWLGRTFPPEHQASIVWTTAAPACEVHATSFCVREFAAVASRLSTDAAQAALYVPPKHPRG